MRQSLVKKSPVQAVDFTQFDGANPLVDGPYSIVLPIGYDPGKWEDQLWQCMRFGVNEVMLPYQEGKIMKVLESEVVQEMTAHPNSINISVLMPIDHPDKIEWAYHETMSCDKVYAVGFRPVPLMRREGAPEGWERVVLIRQLVESKVFDARKKHRLVGFTNPAELVAYSKLFSSFVFGALDVAVGSLCFLLSVYGVQLSRWSGMYHRALRFKDQQEIMGTYRLGDEQLELFYLNKEIIDRFAEGIGGEGLYEQYIEYGGWK